MPLNFTTKFPAAMIGTLMAINFVSYLDRTFVSRWNHRASTAKAALQNCSRRRRARPWHPSENPLETIGALRRHGYEIAAIETSVHAVDLFDWKPRFPVCVLFGYEVDGQPPALLDRCDTHVRLPMLGLRHSLNVASAGAIVMYELLRKYRELVRTGLRPTP